MASHESGKGVKRRYTRENGDKFGTFQVCAKLPQSTRIAKPALLDDTYSFKLFCFFCFFFFFNKLSLSHYQPKPYKQQEVYFLVIINNERYYMYIEKRWVIYRTSAITFRSITADADCLSHQADYNCCRHSFSWYSHLTGISQYFPSENYICT